jgi:hypothetical protein
LLNICRRKIESEKGGIIISQRIYTLDELSHRAELRSRRAELLIETLILVHGGPEELAEIARLDHEIDFITAELTKDKHFK